MEDVQLWRRREGVLGLLVTMSGGPGWRGTAKGQLGTLLSPLLQRGRKEIGLRETWD